MQQLRLLDSVVAAAGAAGNAAPLRLHVNEPSPGREASLSRFWRPVFGRRAADVICGEGTAAEVDWHTHEAVQVLLPLSPVVVVGGVSRRTVLRPGMIHVTAPLELRALRSLDAAPFSTRILLVSPTALAQWAGAGADTALRLPELVLDDELLYGELMAAFDALRRPLVAVGADSRLLERVAHVVRRGASARDYWSTVTPPGVVRARDYLRTHAVQRVTLDELAKVACLSKFYLLRAFHRAYGLTPHSYQMQLRLARARRLLAEGRPLSHVTYDAAFADQSHLTRRFATFYGLTPARFARQLATPPGAAPVHRDTVVDIPTPPTAA